MTEKIDRTDGWYAAQKLHEDVCAVQIEDGRIYKNLICTQKEDFIWVGDHALDMSGKKPSQTNII